MLNHVAQEGHCILNAVLGSFEDMELSERIRRVIKAAKDAGKNQKAVADHIGVNSSSITHWKNGETKSLKLHNLYRMADYTGFSARWIAIGEGPERNSDLPGVQLTSDESALLSIYRDMPQYEREMLFGLINGMKSVKPSGPRPDGPHPKKKDNKEVREVGS